MNAGASVGEAHSPRFFLMMYLKFIEIGVMHPVKANGDLRVITEDQLFIRLIELNNQKKVLFLL